MSDLNDLLKVVNDFKKRWPAPRTPIITLGSMEALTGAVERIGMTLYPVSPSGAGVTSLYGIRVFVDTNLAPGEMKITDDDGNTLIRVISDCEEAAEL